MSTIKERITEVIQEQAEDASYEEILRALAFENMAERGLADSRDGRVVSSEEIRHRMEEWRK